jgi:predicted RNase H-like HicB family nuclease
MPGGSSNVVAQLCVGLQEWAVPFRLDKSEICGYLQTTDMKIELDREEDGRWLTEIPELPGVMAYGQTRDEALAKVKALALRVLADRLEHGEAIPELVDVFSVAA